MNHITQTCQTDIIWTLIEFKWSIGTLFWWVTPQQMIICNILQTTEPMNHSSIIHLSMDGPSVKHKFHRDLKGYRKKEKLPEMINFGNCNLHVLHGAFKSGFQNTDWGIKFCWNPAIKSCTKVLHAEKWLHLNYKIN